MRCPICKSKVSAQNEDRPFCSARCKRIDLGNWLTAAYRVSRPMNEDEVEAVMLVDETESTDEVN
ncbi:MAG: DNA gyrase inhibitor YacG [Myxococcota bacterium]